MNSLETLPVTGLVVTVVVVIIVVIAIFASFKMRRAASACLRRHRVEYMIDEDISNGHERNELPAFSYIRHDQTPVDFHYVTDHVKLDQTIHPDTSLANMNRCLCQGDCSQDCHCLGGTLCGYFYNEDGQLSDSFQLESPEIIRECNVACKCNPKLCKNRVIQAGCKAKLVLFKTKTRGWGVRTLEDLKRGTFIGVYSGELVSVVASQQRQDDTYLFNLSKGNEVQTPATRPEDKTVAAEKLANEQPTEATNDKQPSGGEIVEDSAQETAVQPAKARNHYVCDAKFYGNFTRFINHSCEPNVVGIRTFTLHQDDRFPHIAFFTNREIKAGTELTLNYGDSYWLVKCKRDKVYCLCKRSKCKFNKHTLSTTMEQYQNNSSN